MPEATLAEQLADAATTAYAVGVPPTVQASVRQRLLDTLGICFAARELATSQAAVAHIRTQGGHPRAHIIGDQDLVAAGQAAFVNGVLAHSLDYDDTHLPSVLHPSASVIPAALAAAEASNADGAATIRAIAIGLEVTVRLGMAGYDRRLGNSVFFEHGQHATSICGAMGAGIAAALLLGLDADGVRNTLGLTASMAAGIIECNRTGGTVKRLHCGWAAQSGIAAAELVTHGFTGPPTVLEGRFGFFEAYLRGAANPEEITRGLGTDWAVPDIFFKPYPANHFTHAAIDAGLALRARGVQAHQISSLSLGVPAAVVRTIGQPIEAKRTPETGYQAQFSGPYAVVAGLLGGRGLGVGLQDFTDELARDPLRRSLMALVDVQPDARCDSVFPFQFPAVLTARLVDGTEVVEEVMANRGGDKRPLSDQELSVKFRENISGQLPADVVDQLQMRLLRLDGGDSVSALLALFCRPTAGQDGPAAILLSSDYA